MCGQAGVAGSITTVTERLFQRLLVYSSVRGQDSTGAASIKRHEVKGRPVCKVAKELGNPYELLNISRKFPEEDFQDVLSGTSKVLLGHCRSSTVGESTRRNAHPFLFENLVGTHNGTFTLDTRKDFKDYAFYDTDSQAFYGDMNDNGIESVFGKIGKDDAYSLIWYDFNENTLNFLRNNKRPLYYCFDKDHTQIFWASEAGHLFAALKCEGSDAIQTAEGSPEKWIFELPVDTHLCWKIPDQNQAFDKAKACKREGKKPDPFLYLPDRRRQNWRNGTAGGTTGANASGADDNIMGYYNVSDGDSPFWDEFTDDSKPLPVVVETDGNRAEVTYWDETNKYYKIFSPSRNTVFGFHKSGPWYSSPQALWDSLRIEDQAARYLYNQYPPGVTIKGQVIEKANELKARTKLSAEEHAKKIEEDAKRAKEQHGKVIAGPGIIDKERRNSLFRKMVESRWAKLDQIRGPNAPGSPVFKDKDKAAYYHSDKKLWETWSYPTGVGNQNTWIRADWKDCPEWVPFTMHDVQARHFWKTVGKKKNKVRAYIGFRGHLLVKSSFEKLMQGRCLNCQRVPVWGNEVTFVSSAHFFCEHCSKDTDRVQQYLKMA